MYFANLFVVQNNIAVNLNFILCLRLFYSWHLFEKLHFISKTGLSYYISLLFQQPIFYICLYVSMYYSIMEANVSLERFSK